MLVFFENLILFLLVVSSIFVLIVSNPIQSLLWLILAFTFSSMFFLIFGAELMSVIIFMVYIGAIAVLFLFVIMMLNIKIIELRFYYLRYLSIGIIVIGFLILEIILSIIFEFNLNNYKFFDYQNWLIFLNFKGNLYLLGSFIYVYNFIIFLLLGIILYVSMFCSIILLVDWNIKVNENKNKIYYDFYYFNNKRIIFLK